MRRKRKSPPANRLPRRASHPSSAADPSTSVVRPCGPTSAAENEERTRAVIRPCPACAPGKTRQQRRPAGPRASRRKPGQMRKPVRPSQAQAGCQPAGQRPEQRQAPAPSAPARKGAIPAHGGAASTRNGSTIPVQRDREMRPRPPAQSGPVRPRPGLGGGGPPGNRGGVPPRGGFQGGGAITPAKATIRVNQRGSKGASPSRGHSPAQRPQGPAR